MRTSTFYAQPLPTESTSASWPASGPLTSIGAAMIARDPRRSFGSILVRPSRGEDGGEPTVVIRYCDAHGHVRTKSIGPDSPRIRRLAEQTLARLWTAKLEERATGAKHVAPVTLIDFWAILEPTLKARQKPSSFRVDKQRYLAIADFFGERAMRDLHAEHVQDLIIYLRNKTRVVKDRSASETSDREKADEQTTERKQESKTKTITGVSAGTVNRYISTLSTAFEAALERGYARENPARKVKRAKETLSPVPYLADADIERLVAAAIPSLRPIIRLAAETGLRRSELVGLAWPDVDLGANTILVRVSKSGKPRQVPLTPKAIEVLTTLRDSRAPTPMTGSHLVFPAYQGASRDNVSHRFKHAAIKAGLPATRFHDLRHSFGSRLSRAGVPIPTIASLLGHSPTSIAVTMRYARHAPEDAGKLAIAKLVAASAPTTAATAAATSA